MVELIRSKKFALALLGIGLAIAAYYLHWPDALSMKITSLLGAAIVAQGIADHGSTAARVTTAPPSRPPVRIAPPAGDT